MLHASRFSNAFLKSHSLRRTQHTVSGSIEYTMTLLAFVKVGSVRHHLQITEKNKTQHEREKTTTFIK